MYTQYEINNLLWFAGVKHKHFEGIYKLTTAQELYEISLILRELKYFGNLLLKLKIPSLIINKKLSIMILLGGTSGCGKSTLGSLLSTKIGITNFISTDNLRHMMRAFLSKEQNEILWSSSYSAGEKISNQCEIDSQLYKNKVLEGYESQSKLLLECLIKLLESYSEVGESVVIEGVHLCPQTVERIRTKFKLTFPERHKERFSTRAKYMALNKDLNKYISYFDNIRLIQAHIMQNSKALKIPLLNNTNVDRSVSIIRGSIINTLQTIFVETNMDDHSCRTTKVKEAAVSEIFLREFENLTKASKSKIMLERIHLKSSRKINNTNVDRSNIEEIHKGCAYMTNSCDSNHEDNYEYCPSE